MEVNILRRYADSIDMDKKLHEELESIDLSRVTMRLGGNKLEIYLRQRCGESFFPVIDTDKITPEEKKEFIDFFSLFFTKLVANRLEINTKSFKENLLKNI